MPMLFRIPHSSRGFTILEVVVSVGLIAIMLLLAYTMYANVLTVQELKQRDIALKISSHQIENLRGLGYSALPASGSFSNADLSLLPSGAGAMAVSVYNAQTKQVTVTVSWAGLGGNESVSLSTLIVNSGGLK